VDGCRCPLTTRTAPPAAGSAATRRNASRPRHGRTATTPPTPPGDSSLASPNGSITGRRARRTVSGPPAAHPWSTADGTGGAVTDRSAGDGRAAEDGTWRRHTPPPQPIPSSHGHEREPAAGPPRARLGRSDGSPALLAYPPRRGSDRPARRHYLRTRHRGRVLPPPATPRPPPLEHTNRRVLIDLTRRTDDHHTHTQVVPRSWQRGGPIPLASDTGHGAVHEPLSSAATQAPGSASKPHKAQVVYSCRVNLPPHNPSGRGFESHPPHGERELIPGQR
jgi:hypothetical protein